MRQFIYNWYIYTEELEILEKGHSSDVSSFAFENFGIFKGEEKTFFNSVKEITKKIYKEIKTVYPSYFDNNPKETKVTLSKSYDADSDFLNIRIKNIKKNKGIFIDANILFLA